MGRSGSSRAKLAIGIKKAREARAKREAKQEMIYCPKCGYGWFAFEGSSCPGCGWDSTMPPEAPQSA